MKKPFEELRKKLEETKKYLWEQKEVGTKALGERYENLKKEFEKSLKALDGRKDLIREAIRKRVFMRKFRLSIVKMLFPIQLKMLIAAPFIYMMFIPAVVMHLFLFVYQQTAFRLLGIPLVRVSDHILMDRLHLSYLNSIEKFNCIYCSYFNGLVSYCREIAGRTERYWCPIKYAKRVHEPHSHYEHFSEYLDAEGFRENWNSIRYFEELRDKEESERGVKG